MFGEVLFKAGNFFLKLSVVYFPLCSKNVFRKAISQQCPEVDAKDAQTPETGTQTLAFVLVKEKTGRAELLTCSCLQGSRVGSVSCCVGQYLLCPSVCEFRFRQQVCLEVGLWLEPKLLFLSTRQRHDGGRLVVTSAF